MTIKILTNLYGSGEAFIQSMQALQDTIYDVDPLDIEHVVLDQHYPLNHSKLNLLVSGYAFRAPYQVTILDAGRNLGLHEGLNYMIKETCSGVADSTLIVGYDPDEKPLQSGWIPAMQKVFAAAPQIGWLSLMRDVARDYMLKHGHTRLSPAGINVMSPPYPLINMVCGWRLGDIRAIGPFTEPHAFYGGLESAMMPKFTKAGLAIGYLDDYEVTPLHHLADVEYTLYKMHHVGHKQPVFPGSFDEWLARAGNAG